MLLISTLADTVIPIYTRTCIFQPFYSPCTKAQLSRNEERPALARCHCSSTPQESRNPRTRSDACNDLTAGSAGQRVSVSVRSGLHRAVASLYTCSPVCLCPSDTPYTHAVPSLCPSDPPYTRSPVSVCPSDPPYTRSPVSVCPSDPPYTISPVSECPSDLPYTRSPVSVCPSDLPYTLSPVSECPSDLHYTRSPVSVCLSDPPHAIQSRL